MSSGLTYALIFKTKELNVKQFYFKRLKRLLAPVWLFLTFFFLSTYIVTTIFSIPYPFNAGRIFSAYLFMDGIGFVWIFKVYLILALITPLAIYLNRKIVKNKTYFFFLITFYIIYETAKLILLPHLNDSLVWLFNSTVFILWPYSILYLYSFRISILNRNHTLFISLASFLFFLLLAFAKSLESGEFVPTQKFKYPPSFYYLAYAFFAINLLYWITMQINFSREALRKKIIWLSENSLWIYLWHIFGYYIWTFSAPNPNGDVPLFLMKSTFLFSFGIILTNLQNKFVAIFSSKNETFKNYFSFAFTSKK